MNNWLVYPEKKIPIIAEADLLVVGGSCTGVFAAVRAARLGLKVILVEKQNCLGGVAVSGLVNIWHSLMDIDEKKQVIAGLTNETIERLQLKRAAEKTLPVVEYGVPSYWSFNSARLSIVLDEYINENKIKLMLHTSFVDVILEERQIQSVVVNTVEGLRGIKAKFFIDATGNGVMAKSLNCPSFVHDNIQPPSTCWLMQGNISDDLFRSIFKKHAKEFGLEDEWGWYSYVPGLKDITMRANTRVYGVRCDKVDDLSRAEVEARKTIGTIVDMLNKYVPEEDRCEIISFASNIGVRETIHFQTKYRANVFDLLHGKRFEHPIMNGSYRIDIHHAVDKGITFRYLDGREVTVEGNNANVKRSNWREDEGLSGEAAKYYQLPLESLIGEEYDNFITVGRMINADKDSFGALRVMVNLNQLGEASGVAAFTAIDKGTSIQNVDADKVVELLKKGGSAL